MIFTDEKRGPKPRKKATAPTVNPTINDIKQILDQISTAMQYMASSNANTAHIEAMTNAVAVGLTEATAALRRLNQPIHPKQWTFDVERDADGKITSIIANSGV